MFATIGGDAKTLETASPCLAGREPEELTPRFDQQGTEEPMRKHSLLLAVSTLVLTSGITAESEGSQDKTDATTALQSVTPDKPPIAIVPEPATDVAAVPRRPQTSGQAPNVSKKMGAEMDSAGDQRTSPDEQ